MGSERLSTTVEYPHPLSRRSNSASLIGLLISREKEVLNAMARGLNNQEISESLFIGAATVKTHVPNVLSKLGLRDRAQAVVFAYESGLIATGSPNSDLENLNQ